MANDERFENAPDDPGNDPIRALRVHARIINAIMQGKTYNTGSVTLTESAASTHIIFSQGRLGIDTVVNFTPKTANAAAELAAGTMYESSRDVRNRILTITHANNSQTDRDFDFTLVG